MVVGDLNLQSLRTYSQLFDQSIDTEWIEKEVPAEILALLKCGQENKAILELMKWFRDVRADYSLFISTKIPTHCSDLLQKFFTWVAFSPSCTNCGIEIGRKKGDSITPTNEEQLDGASRWVGNSLYLHKTYPSTSVHVRKRRVEVFECTQCRTTTRFPRYQKVTKLLETRRGRCGEWAKTFTLLLHSMRLDCRLVVDWTDHVWTEIWLKDKGRFVHFDVCEAIWDEPLLYEKGWKKELNYVIAFGPFEAVDVTRQYTANFDEVKNRRTIMTEEELRDLLTVFNQELEKKGWESHPESMSRIRERRKVMLETSATIQSDRSLTYALPTRQTL